MVSLDITLTLADDVAQAAQARGILTSQALERLVEAELDRQQHIDNLFTMMDQLADDPKDDLVPSDIATEIAAYRAERLSTAANRS